MRHFTNESTSTFLFSEVRNRSGSSESSVRIRMSKKRTLSITGILKYRPGAVLTLIDFAKPEHHGVLALIHREQTHAGNDQHHHDADQHRAQTGSHRASLSRLRNASRERGAASAAPGTGKGISGIAGLPASPAPAGAARSASACRAAGTADCCRLSGRPRSCSNSQAPAASCPDRGGRGSLPAPCCIRPRSGGSARPRPRRWRSRAGGSPPLPGISRAAVPRAFGTTSLA